MPTTIQSHGLTEGEIHAAIHSLINNLVNIQDTTGEFLLKLPDGRVIDTKGWHDWEWTHGVGLYGLYHYYTLTNSILARDAITDWFAKQLAKGTTKNINTMAPLLTLAHLYADPPTRDPTHLAWLDSWAEWAYHDLPRTPGGGMQHLTYLSPNRNELWDDTLMMTVLPLAKIGLVLDRPHYVEEAKRQFLLHCQYLFDPTTSLFFHGWKFEEEEQQPSTGTSTSAPTIVGHNFARARWARGNSWLTIAIPDFIEMLDLPPTDPIRTFLLTILHAQCTALARLQAPTGFWRTLLDVPADRGSYEEASATAGFAYGILKAVRKRYLDLAAFLPVAVKAVRAVLGAVDANGALTRTSFGTAMGADLQHYLDIPVTTMPYGQAMAIMCLAEFLRTFI